jgi:hypothetical protein
MLMMHDGWGGAYGARLCDMACCGRTVRALEQQLLGAEEKECEGTDGGSLRRHSAGDAAADGVLRKRSPRRGSAAITWMPDGGGFGGREVRSEPNVLAPAAGRGWGVACAVFSVLVWAPDGVFVSKLKAETEGQSDAIVVRGTALAKGSAEGGPPPTSVAAQSPWACGLTAHGAGVRRCCGSGCWSARSVAPRCR